MKSDFIHGLSDDVINYVVQHVENILTPEDILQNCPIRPYDVADQISNVINKICGDDIMYNIIDTDNENKF